ncbi:MAG: DUF1634 domain-containing protein [Thermoguttaceae bacterium]
MVEKSQAADPSAPAVMKRFELLISRMLLSGVVISMATVLLGLLLMFVHHPDYLKSAADLQRLTAPGAAFPNTLGDIARGVVTGRGQAVVAVGLLLLIAAPILRVAVSMLAFALQRDRTYAAISAVVLVILLISFLLGKVE